MYLHAGVMVNVLCISAWFTTRCMALHCVMTAMHALMLFALTCVLSLHSSIMFTQQTVKPYDIFPDCKVDTGPCISIVN